MFVEKAAKEKLLEVTEVLEGEECARGEVGEKGATGEAVRHCEPRSRPDSRINTSKSCPLPARQAFTNASAYFRGGSAMVWVALGI